MLHSQDKQATSLQKVFTFNGTIDVQVVMVNGEPHFVVADVCHVLTLTNTTKALYGLDDDEILTLPVVRSGQQRTVNVVNESGLYALIFQSRKPIAKQFRRWVTSEVLPAIRETGGYTAPAASDWKQKFENMKYAYGELRKNYELLNRDYNTRMECYAQMKDGYYKLCAFRSEVQELALKAW